MDLKINYTIENNVFTCTDSTDYSGRDVASVEYIKKINYFQDEEFMTNAIGYPPTKITQYEFKNDGYYIYNKCIVDNYTNFLNQGIYEISGKYFYYNMYVYFGLNNVSDESQIKENSREVLFFDELESDFELELFPMDIIKGKLLDLQYKSLINGCDEDLRLERDFLFTSVSILEYFVSQKNYNEAQKLLENLLECKNSLRLSSLNKCNCGYS